MRKLGVALVLLVACSSSGPRLPSRAQGETVLEVRGAIAKGPHALGRADLAALPRLSVRGVDPVTGREAEWEGISVAAVVSERVELDEAADVAVARTAAGAAVPIPLTLIRTFRPVLADRADGEPLAAPVIAWPNVEQRGLGSDPRSVGWWARDVVAFEVVVWEATFAKALAVPPGASDAARRGAAWYSERCIACHGVRGAGGARGPDLSEVAQRLDRTAFATVLERHPGWTGVPGDPPGARGTEELFSFLHALAQSPGAPEDLRADSGASEPDSP